MENGENFKKINVGENFLQFKSNKKQTRGQRAKREAVSQLKPLTVKELLLKKLQQYKKEKSRKNRVLHQQAKFHNPVPPALTSSFLNSAKQTKKPRISPPKMNHNYGRQEPEHLQQPEYGNLKNGIKPTFRQFHKNKTVKYKSPTHVNVEIEKTFNVGKNTTQKKVGVFIKSNELRRKINEEKVDIQKSNIKTVKNYLKTQNLIKYGSNAPNELLREIYSTSKLCGDVFNINGQSLVHNYMNKTS